MENEMCMRTVTLSAFVSVYTNLCAHGVFADRRYQVYLFGSDPADESFGFESLSVIYANAIEEDARRRARHRPYIKSV